MISSVGFSAEFREITTETGHRIKIDPESHRIYFEVQNGKVWVSSNQQIFINQGVSINPEFPPVIINPPENLHRKPAPGPPTPPLPPPLPLPRPEPLPSQGTSSAEEVLRGRIIGTPPSGGGYAPTIQLSTGQIALITQAVNEIFGPGVPVRDYSAITQAAQQNAELSMRTRAEIEAIKNTRPTPYKLRHFEPSEEQIQRLKKPKIIDAPSISDPSESELPYQIQYQGPERAELIRLYQHLYKIVPETQNRKTARVLGLLSVEEADQSYQLNQLDEAQFYRKLAEEFLDIVIGIDPVTSLARSTYELITGRNLVTGARLQKIDYVLNAFNIFTLGTDGSLHGAYQGLKKVISRGSQWVRNTEWTNYGIKTAEKGIQSLHTFLGREPLKSEIEEAVLIAKQSKRNFDDLLSNLGENVTRYTPINPGPLTALPEGSSTVADTFRSSSYYEHTLKEPTLVYRVFNENGRELSAYWSRVQPTGPYQAVLDSALDPNWGNKATHWIEINVPAGTTVYEGITSQVLLQNHGLTTGQILGGGNQIYIKDKILKDWITSKGKF